MQARNGVQYCRDFHLKHSCPGNCGRSHACLVRTPELVAGMIQRAGKRAPRMTSQSVLRLVGQATWRTTLRQRHNHNFPIQQCGRHLISPGVQEDSSQIMRGGSPMTPPWTSHSSKHFFHGPSLPERLQQGLLWNPSVSPYEVQTPGQLLLYTGKADSQSLDSVLLSLQSQLKGHIIALDIRRSEDHDIFRGDLYSFFFLDIAALVITTVAVMKICYNGHRLITRSNRLVSGQQESKETQTDPPNNQPKPTKSDQSVKVRQVKHVCALTTWCIAQKPRLSQHLQLLIECHTSNT